MSARLNMNPIRYFAWKGKTFAQVTTMLQKNVASNTSVNGKHNLFNPNPLKIYRREIVTAASKPCGARPSIRIDEINAPGGYIVTSKTDPGGLVGTIDPTVPNSRYETTNASCNSTTTCVNLQKSALSRVRSAGMIRRPQINTSDPTGNKKKYYTNTSQYLNSRNMTYTQNEFTYTTTMLDPKGNGCSGVFNPNNKKFSQQGAVTASTGIARTKYDTITTAGAALRSAYGSAMANSVAYGVPQGNNTIKEKTGYTMVSTPKFDFRGNMKICNLPQRVKV